MDGDGGETEARRIEPSTLSSETRQIQLAASSVK